MALSAENADRLVPLRHISGLGANMELLTAEQRAILSEFSRQLASQPTAVANADYVTDSVLVRHLIARDWDIPKALKMIITALEWRIRRPSHRWRLAAAAPGYAGPPDAEAEARAHKFKQSASTGKIRVMGTDRHGRPVMVFDNSRENEADPGAMMEYLAFNMELCVRTAALVGRRCDKIMLLMHMSDFSIFNQPPMAVTKETITIVATSFPEFLGTCVILNPPVGWGGIQGRGAPSSGQLM